MSDYRRSPWSWEVYSIALAGVLCVFCGDLSAQFNPGFQIRNGLPVAPSAAVVRERGVGGRLLEVEGAIGRGEFGAAAGYLAGLLGRDADAMFESGEQRRSLLGEARRLVDGLSGPGLAAWRRQVDADADAALAAASGSGDVAAVADVVKRFPRTAAAASATLLLGLHELDAGVALADAARLAEARRLLATVADDADSGRELALAAGLHAAAAELAAGESAAARDRLLALRDRHGERELLLGGRPTAWFQSEATALAWLSEALGLGAATNPPARWRTAGGDVARTATAAGGAPAPAARWSVPLTETPHAAAALADWQRMIAEASGGAAPPAWRPIAAGGYALVRTPQTLTAINLSSGKRVWRTDPPTAGDLNQLLAAAGATSLAGLAAGSTAAQSVARRVWEDRVYGDLSSDGRRVFLIEALPLEAADLSSPLNRFAPNGAQLPGPFSAAPYNRLAARELASEGKLLWEAGGLDGGDAAETAGAFFLAAPLPWGELLLAPAEVGGELRLFCLRADRGSVAWSQPIGVVEVAINEDVARRLSGAAPAVADGVLVLPTAAGLVVGFDPLARRLRWAFEYRRTIDPLAALGPLVDQTARFALGWREAAPTIVGSRVLLTPPDSQELYCLDLQSGAELWRRRRSASGAAAGPTYDELFAFGPEAPDLFPEEEPGGASDDEPLVDALFVAAANEQTAVVAAATRIYGLRLADGAAAWPPIELPEGRAPTGRGYRDGERLLLPVVGGVAEIDVVAGALRRLHEMDDLPAGSLAVHDGWVLAQGVDRLAAYPQAPALQRALAARLAAEPNDPAARTDAAELALADGDAASALTELTAAAAVYRAGAGDDPRTTAGLARTRRLLVKAGLRRLEEDFAAAAERIPQLLAEATDDAERAAVRRAEYAGRLAAGEWTAAAAAAFAVADDLPERPPLEEIAPGWEVRRDRWVQAALLHLYETGDAATRTAIDEQLAARCTAALAEESPAAWRRLLGAFGALPATDPVRLRLAAASEPLAAEQLLLTLLERPAGAQRCEAAVRLLQLMRRCEQGEAAADYLRLLAGELAEAVAADGRTGGEIAAATIAQLPPEGEIRFWLDAPHVWPPHELIETATRDTTAAANALALQTPVPLARTASPGFHRRTLHLNPATNTLAALNPLGRPAWEADETHWLGEPQSTPYGNQLAFELSNTLRLTAVARGHFAVIATEHQALAANTLVGGRIAGEKIPWRRQLTAGIAAWGGVRSPMQRQMQIMAARRFGAEPPQRQAALLGRQLPIREDVVVQLDQRGATGLIPANGEVAWRRRAARTATLYGDGRRAIAFREGDAAMMMRTIDGGLVAEIDELPSDVQFFVGAQAVRLIAGDQGPRLALWDFEANAEVWGVEVERRAVACRGADDDLLVVGRNGRLSSFDLATGEQNYEAQLVDRKPAEHLQAVRWQDRIYLLVDYSSDEADWGAGRQSIEAETPVVQGRLYALNEAGELIWPSGAVVDGFAWLSTQPAAGPTWAFARRVDTPNSTRAGGRPSRRTEIMLLDRMTGEQLFARRYSRAVRILTIRYSATPPGIEIYEPNGPIRSITFGDRPRPPAPPEQGEAETPTPSGGEGGLLNSIFRLFEG